MEKCLLDAGILPADDMPLNETDRGWIKNTISEALREHSSGWLHLVRQWSPLGAVVAVALFSLNEWGKYVEFRTHTNDEIRKLLAQLGPLRALISANQPLKKQNQDAAKELLAEARSKTIPPIPIPTVDQSGQAFVEAAEVAPGAWTTALDFINYRSSLNAPPPTYQIKPASELTGTAFRLQVAPGGTPPVMMYLGGNPLPQDQASRVELLSNPEKQISKQGIGTFVIEGGAMELDNMHLRRVIVEGVEVHYSGGPVLLEDVIFTNCRFVMDNVFVTRQLASSILESEHVNLKAD